jgi:eukaryotic-like serine/threonine-protein kinase
MTPERWATIERLYHAALEHDADRRETLLREACAGDDHLREEVESLLRYGDKAQAGDFPRTSEAAGLTAQLSAVASVVRRLHEPPAPGGFVGRSFGPYEATTLIAAGGMGEVYRAADRRLDRTVAIKILPEHLAADPERRERFGREARIVGTLNHPHICSLYDIGVQDGVPYLVMEFVDGETLEARIRRGPVPWPESLEHLRQIADALDKAHRHGIVHRDLKPANVMLTRAGVKLLDFGLAAWIVANDRAAVTGSAMDGGKRLTGEGRIMGTAHYLSPEQLQGKQPDARSDIFAFGVLAYEMLAGRPAFEGESHAALIGAILKDEPQPMTERVPDLPDAIARTIARCLSKDPDDRWQTANDLSFQLRSMISASDRPFPTDARQPSRWRERAVWTAAIVACLVLAAFIWERVPPIGVGDNRLPVRVSFAAPDGEAFAAGFDTPFAVAPDGRSIAFVSTTAGGTRQLWIRSLQNEHQEAVPGTEGARDPFWSPDSQWIGFFEAATLKKVRVSSGLTQVIARNVSTIGGASWNTDDTILFPSGPGGLSRVASVGGTVMPATRAAAGGHLWPQFLGNGRHFIYIAGVTRSIEIGSLDDDSSRTLMVFPIRPSALAYASGYVFYVNDNVLFARPFDERRLDFSGEPTRVAEGVPVMGPGRARFSVSAAGVLAYWPHPHGLPARLRWFDRAGHPSSAVDTPALYQGFGLSPNGDRLVFSRTDKTGGADLWLRDPVRHAETQLTFDRAAFTPRWLPDGTRVAFAGPGLAPPPKLFVQDVARSGAAILVADSGLPTFASGWTADGRSIVAVQIDPVNGYDLWLHGVNDKSARRLSINTASDEYFGTVSPDNRWIAYVSNESGRTEVWVARFPSGEPRRRVSTSGGTMPQWTDQGKEIVFVSSDKRVTAVRFRPGSAGVDIGPPQVLFSIDDLLDVDRASMGTENTFAATSDGRRFLAAVHAPDSESPPLKVLVNWPALLRR